MTNDHLLLPATRANQLLSTSEVAANFLLQVAIGISPLPQKANNGGPIVLLDPTDEESAFFVRQI